MIVLLIKHKFSQKETGFLLKQEKDVEVVREIAMRLQVFLDDFEITLQHKLPY